MQPGVDLAHRYGFQPIGARCGARRGFQAQGDGQGQGSAGGPAGRAAPRRRPPGAAAPAGASLPRPMWHRPGPPGCRGPSRSTVLVDHQLQPGPRELGGLRAPGCVAAARTGRRSSRPGPAVGGSRLRRDVLGPDPSRAGWLGRVCQGGSVESRHRTGSAGRSRPADCWQTEDAEGHFLNDEGSVLPNRVAAETPHPSRSSGC